MAMTMLQAALTFFAEKMRTLLSATISKTTDPLAARSHHTGKNRGRFI